MKLIKTRVKKMVWLYDQFFYNIEGMYEDGCWISIAKTVQATPADKKLANKIKELILKNKEDYEVIC